ncbi:MAG: diaminopimelate epimerase [Magnetococcales bacterium]|nr:diaminopimelate epimerase [Magnetococcales bacterium]
MTTTRTGSLPFFKMHGLGNDFVLLDFSEGRQEPEAAWMARIADRRFGVGCDQVVVLSPPREASCTVRMRIYNADGSQAEMCGNAVRCVALYLRRHRNLTLPVVPIETLAGVIRPRLLDDDRVEVNMGRPELDGLRIPTIWPGPVFDQPLSVAGHTLLLTAVSMGNPHVVHFCDDVTGFPLQEVGPLVEHHAAFPKRTNVEIAQVIDRATVRMRVWERGVGITPACGTGACAVAVAAMLHHRVEREVVVRLDGGELAIRWSEEGALYMTGPATEVFFGRMPLPFDRG